MKTLTILTAVLLLSACSPSIDTVFMARASGYCNTHDGVRRILVSSFGQHESHCNDGVVFNFEMK